MKCNFTYWYSFLFYYTVTDLRMKCNFIIKFIHLDIPARIVNKPRDNNLSCWSKKVMLAFAEARKQMSNKVSETECLKLFLHAICLALP